MERTEGRQGKTQMANDAEETEERGIRRPDAEPSRNALKTTPPTLHFANSLIYKEKHMAQSERRTIVVGDIHGCYDELTELIDKVKLKKTDRVVSVGDLITKGPKSREVLE